VTTELLQFHQRQHLARSPSPIPLRPTHELER
jgi:hypothetical protein